MHRAEECIRKFRSCAKEEREGERLASGTGGLINTRLTLEDGRTELLGRWTRVEQIFAAKPQLQAISKSEAIYGIGAIPQKVLDRHRRFDRQGSFCH